MKLVVLFLILTSSSAFAFFGKKESLRCDLSVGRLSDRVVSSEKVSGTFHNNVQDYSIEAAAQRLKNIYKDNAMIEFKEKNSLLRNCRITDAKYIETERVSTAGTHLSCSQLPGAGCTPKQHFKLTQECDLVEYEVLSVEERQAAICQKALDCSKNIKNSKQAKEHKALVAELCDSI